MLLIYRLVHTFGHESYPCRGPWLYNYVGQPWKTQQLVDRVRSQLFGPTPGGEPGNDDPRSSA